MTEVCKRWRKIGLKWLVQLKTKWEKWQSISSHRHINFIQVQKVVMFHLFGKNQVMSTNVTPQFLEHYLDYSVPTANGRKLDFHLQWYDPLKASEQRIFGRDGDFQRFMVIEYSVNYGKNQLAALYESSTGTFPPIQDFDQFDFLADALPLRPVKLSNCTNKKELDITQLLDRCRGPFGIISQDPSKTAHWVQSELCKEHNWTATRFYIYATYNQEDAVEWLSAMSNCKIQAVLEEPTTTPPTTCGA